MKSNAAAFPVEFGKILDDGEPKTEPTVQTRTGSVCLTETIKNVRQKPGRASLSGIGDADLDMRYLGAERCISRDLREKKNLKRETRIAERNRKAETENQSVTRNESRTSRPKDRSIRRE